MIRLANLDADTFWANRAWSEFAADDKPRTLVILPVFGFADHGLGCPLDVEEVVGAALLRSAATAVKNELALRVLPPLRFALAPYPSTFFGIDPETAHDLVREIAESVKAAGFAKLVFLNTSPWNEELVDAASRDTRAALGLQTFVINAGGLGLDLHPTSTTRSHVQAAAARLLGNAPKRAKHEAEIRDANFRPGEFRQPEPLDFDFSLNGFKILADASAHLARLLAEVDARPPLGSSQHSSPADLTALSAPAFSIADLWPAHRSRYLAALTRDELEHLPEKERALVILPTGAVEQHGPHLPVGVDAFLGQLTLDHALPRLRPNAAVYVAPPLTYGKSNEHVGFPGTVYLSAKTFRRLVLALAAQLHALGFRQLAVLNSHGGNSAVLVYTLREIQTTLGMRAGMLSGYYKPDQSPQEANYGFHAGEFETSLMLAGAPELVRMDKAVAEFPARIDDPGELRPENAPAIFSWITQDVSRSGVMGDATIATAEKGRRWLDAASVALARRIESLLETPPA